MSSFLYGAIILKNSFSRSSKASGSNARMPFFARHTSHWPQSAASFSPKYDSMRLTRHESEPYMKSFIASSLVFIASRRSSYTLLSIMSCEPATLLMVW